MLWQLDLSEAKRQLQEDSNFKAHLLRISKVPQLGFF
jgi:hypothetical protein